MRWKDQPYRLKKEFFMINLVTGRCGSGKSRTVTEMIKTALSETDADIVLIVPEQQTVVWETKIAELLPESVYLRLEISSFTRLANSVFRKYGGLSDIEIDRGARSLIIWKAMISVWSELKTYNNCALGREDRNISELMRAVDELKGSGVSPAEAEEALCALGETDDASLSARLHDAVLVYAAYNDILHENYVDRGDILYSLEQTLRSHDFFAGKKVFVDSFFSLTAAEERILSVIMKTADDTTVTFSFDPKDRENIAFAEVAEFYKRTLHEAHLKGREIRHIALTENRRHKNAPLLAKIERYIFDYESEIPEEEHKTDENSAESIPQESSPHGGAEPEAVIVKCADRFDEAEACASVIDKLIRMGYKYSDIAVVARNINKSAGTIDTALRSHGIPCFISEAGSVSASPAVRLIAEALTLDHAGWQRENILNIIKTGLTPLSEYEGDAFEMYTSAWNINGKRRFTSGGWSMNPEGYKMELTEHGKLILSLANSAREALVPPIERFLSVFDGAGGEAKVEDIARAAVYFAEEMNVYERLSALRDEYAAIGMKAEGEKAVSSWNAVCEIFDRMAEICGGINLTSGRFLGLFTRVAESMDVGAIPQGVDEVILGSSSGVRFDEVKCVILIGSVEGEFPGEAGDGDCFFKERDRVVLEGAGLNIKGTDEKLRAAGEYFMYYRTAAAAKEKLYILAPMAGGAALSEGALRAAEIARKSGYDIVKTYAAEPLSSILYHEKSAEYLLSRRYSEKERAFLDSLAEKKDVPDDTGGEFISPVDLPYGKKMSLSQSKITSFVGCPFGYSCKYLMKLFPDAKAEISSPDIGNFVHGIMEQYFSDPRAVKLGGAEKTSFINEIIEDYIEKLREGSSFSDEKKGSGRMRYLFRRLKRHVSLFIDVMGRELLQSGFAPKGFEIPIGGEGENSVRPMIIKTADGAEVTLRGRVDRIDILPGRDGKNYFRVIDYKTGSKRFSLDDVYRGTDVQLIVYLSSIWHNGLPGDGGEYLPAGAEYVNLRAATVSMDRVPAEGEARAAAEAKTEQSGIFIDDEGVIYALEEGRRGTVPANKNGSFLGNGITFVSAAELGKICSDVNRVIGDIAYEMRRGKACAEPDRKSDPCKWCDYRLICRREEK